MRRTARIAGGLIAGMAASPIVVVLLAAPPASTHPIAEPFVLLNTNEPERRNVQINPRLTFDTTGATLTATVGRRVVYVEPLLSFNQRSPDGCWTIFAPRADRVPPRRVLDATAIGEGSVDAGYRDEDACGVVATQRLRIARSDDRTFDVDASAGLPAVVWSHLNTFAQVTIAGHRSLRLRFSPTGPATIDVTAAGYPRGAPARFAYVDAFGTFRVVEASSAETAHSERSREGRSATCR